MRSNECFIKAESISLIIDKRVILKNISFSANGGSIICFIGPNGGGKTSLLKLLFGSIYPSSGKLFIKQKSSIYYMPQKISVNSSMPMAGKEFINAEQFATNIDLCHDLGLSNFIRYCSNRKLRDMSDGELQRLSFARAISNKPDILLMDEPVSCMDLCARNDFYSIVSSFIEKTGCTVIMTSHDLLAVMKKIDTVYCLNQELKCTGYPENESSLRDRAILDEFSMYYHEGHVKN